MQVACNFWMLHDLHTNIGSVSPYKDYSGCDCPEDISMLL